MKGRYDEFGVYKFDYPICNGNEGSGVVVASGGGIMANRAVGKKVAFVRIMGDNEYTVGGAFQQYALSNAISLI